jgi:hypothetical protein
MGSHSANETTEPPGDPEQDHDEPGADYDGESVPCERRSLKASPIARWKVG